MKSGSTGEGDAPPGGGEAPRGGRRVTIMGRKFRVPDSPHVRMGAGLALIAGGTLGFLPVLGFWMIPLGLVILSVDLPAVRRVRRRMEVYFGRKANGMKENGLKGIAQPVRSKVPVKGKANRGGSKGNGREPTSPAE